LAFSLIGSVSDWKAPILFPLFHFFLYRQKMQALQCGVIDYNLPCSIYCRQIVSFDKAMHWLLWYFLILQDDGNLCIYKGTGPSDNQGIIWSSRTTGRKQQPNPNFAASKGL
jgi:hypothetical protein